MDFLYSQRLFIKSYTVINGNASTTQCNSPGFRVFTLCELDVDIEASAAYRAWKPWELFVLFAGKSTSATAQKLVLIENKPKSKTPVEKEGEKIRNLRSAI